MPTGCACSNPKAACACDATVLTQSNLNALITDIRTLDNHSFVLVKKPYDAGDPSFLLTLGAEKEARQAYDEAIELYRQAALWHAANEQTYYR